MLIAGLLITACAHHDAPQHDTGVIIIDRTHYANQLRGFWLGSNIANWTGLPTENVKAELPFFTDDDWRTNIGRDGEVVDYVLNSDPWGADDDTDIEYVYQSAMERFKTHKLTGQQISSAWQDHVGLPLLWVSNLAALGQMQNGAVPPATSLPENNPMWDMIDAQLTTEIFGTFAPGRPDVALDIAHLPIRTTAYLHSEWAAEFYVIMHSLVPLVDPSLSRADQVTWLATQARQRIPDWSYIADMYDFVKAAYDDNSDKNDWESTRDAVYFRYQLGGAADYQYKYPWDAGINFASSMISLFYGQGDYQRTIRIGTLAGWDSDNPTATWGGLLGLLYGHAKLQTHFSKSDFSDDYLISRTRYGFSDMPDNFYSMAERALTIIDDVVTHEMAGRIENNQWIIPRMTKAISAPVIVPTTVAWQTIEDSDPRWTYEGFTTHDRQWNASGATLTRGQSGCSAQITFSGTAVQYYAYRSAASGTVSIALDNKPLGSIDLASTASPKGQYYAKVFERHKLPAGKHTLHIECDENDTTKTIDMLSIIP